MAYLASTLFLDDGSELIVLIVNTLTRDLTDDNFLIGAAIQPQTLGRYSYTATAVLHSMGYCSELIVLLVNTLTRDLTDDNFLIGAAH